MRFLPDCLCWASLIGSGKIALTLLMPRTGSEVAVGIRSET